MSNDELKQQLLTIAEECLAKGPGYSQEGVVIREATQRLQLRNNLPMQQKLLTCWHDLFREGPLSWGYDVDNPGSPFFHVRKDDLVGHGS